MKNLVIDGRVLDDLYDGVEEEIKEKAKQYIEQKKVEITKVIYENKQNFEIKAIIKENKENNQIYLKVHDGEIEDVNCDCMEYKKSYSSCSHILATISEFANNPEYIRIFTGEKKENETSISIQSTGKTKENYRIFKQLIHEFYHSYAEEEEEITTHPIFQNIHLVPKLIYDTYAKTLKLEIKIGDKQLYKIKSLPEFYDRMLNEEVYRYGSKLEFAHTKEAFAPEDVPLLEFVLKYAEIIKYANEATGEYEYYGRKLSDHYIVISNSGLDDLFQTLVGKKVFMETAYLEEEIEFIGKEPDIRFEMEEENEEEYKISPNIDVYGYEVLEGKEYMYILLKHKLYRCSKKFKETVLKFLEVFRKNFSKEIVFKKEGLQEFFSLVLPKVKKNISLEKVDYEKIKEYIPEELYVKIYLDYDNHNYIVADIRFCYGEKEFNPLLEEENIVARDVAKETEILNMFRKTGFMLDTHHARLILVNEDTIYHFLSVEIETYMQKFEILATESFKQKEIKEPKISSLGIKIENNLLQVDFSGLDFDISELADVMKQYKLKKKYHRLKDGSFLKLEENETVAFLENLSEGMDINFKEIEKGELKLPIYRSLYLDRILGKIKATHIRKDEEYKTIVDRIDNRELEENIQLPQKLNATLRPYQQIGYKWLKVLDTYGLGGILADDMGLRKNSAAISGAC